MLEAAKSMFSKLLEETNDDLDRALQPQEDHRAQANGNESRCSRAETSSKSPCPPTEAVTEIPCSHFETNRSDPFLLRERIIPSREPLELVLSVSTCRNGGWKYEFKTSSLTATILNEIFNDAGNNGKSRNFRTYIGPGSDGSSTDKLSLDLKFNPRNTATSSRPGEERFMCETVFTQCDLPRDLCAEQKDVRIDWVKTLSCRPSRCLIIVHRYFSTQRRTELMTKSVQFSRAKLYVSVPCSSSDLYEDQRATLNKKQENGTSNSETFAMGMKQASRNLLTNTISHGQTIVHTMTSAIKTSKKAVGYSIKIFDPGKERSAIN